MLTRISDLASRRPWRIMVVAVAFAALAVLFGAMRLGNLSTGGSDDPSSEAAHAASALSRAGGIDPGDTIVALVSPGADVRSGAGAREVARVAATLRATAGVARVVTPARAGPALVSRDGDSAYVVAQPWARADEDAVAARAERRLADDPAVTLGGSVIADRDTGDIIGADIARAELIAFPILFLLSLLIFRGVVAALLPPLIGGLAILGGMLGLAVANGVTTISTYAINLVIGLGLGLAIDYGLLMVSRYREEIAARGPGRAALGATMRTAGRSVGFSALTVAAALAGLLVFPQGFLRSMGIGGVVVALVAAALSLTVLPAILALLGRRIDAGAPARWRRTAAADDEVTSGFWYRLSSAIVRRPAPYALAGAAIMVLLALPAIGIRFTTIDAGALPTSSSARLVHDAIERDFPTDASSPAVIAVSAPDGPVARSALRDYAGRLREVPGVASVAAPRPVGDRTWRIDASLAGEALSPGAQDAVGAVRAVPAPYPVLVGGETATLVDDKASLAAHLPAAAAVIVGATLLLLFLLTGSVVLAAKGVVMNALTVGATLGILKWGFQDGALEGLLGFHSLGGVSTTQPILIAALAFALSTDYGVFLLSRITEAHDAGRSPQDAVAIGLQRTGRIVTAAALLFVVAIGAFAASRIVVIKEIGVGTAVAVALDATIVRAVLVPALMGLLGRWNWWAPRPLARLHARLGLGSG
jgi:uncharacterized membrane protein YdfJ with MMPL/SSD domain